MVGQEKGCEALDEPDATMKNDECFELSPFKESCASIFLRVWILPLYVYFFFFFFIFHSFANNSMKDTNLFSIYLLIYLVLFST